MTPDICLILFLLLSAIVAFALSIKRKQFSNKNKKHEWRIKQAATIINKLKMFEGEYRIPQSLTYLRKINPYTFEELLLTSFSSHGYQIQRNKSYSGDGGIDGKVYNKKGDCYLVQAKRYKGNIKKEHLQRFIQSIEEHNAQGGFFIHTGKTSNKCKMTIRETSVTILSGTRLINFITL